MRTTLEETPKSEKQPKKAFYRNLWVQVLAAVAIAIVLGYVRPNTAPGGNGAGAATLRANWTYICGFCDGAATWRRSCTPTRPRRPALRRPGRSWMLLRCLSLSS